MKQDKIEKEFKDKLQKLRKDLTGRQSSAAKAIGVDPSLVNRVLSGQRHNIDLLNKLVEYRDQIITEKNEKFKQFLNQA